MPFQINALGDSLKEGDVILSNHPSAGGSHLPDLTVITPVCSIFTYPITFTYKILFYQAVSFRHKLEANT